MAIADLLAKLVEMKNQLVANLNSMGVAADQSEKLNTLVPKVLDIETGVDTTDATATAADIAVGKTAYVNDEKITGTLNLVNKNEVEFSYLYSGSYYGNNGAIIVDYTGLQQSIKKVRISDGVTQIGTAAFYYCTNLESIIIPDSVTSFGDLSFYYCRNLADIYYTGTQEQWDAISKPYYKHQSYGLYITWDNNMGSNVSGGTTIHYNYVPE